MQRLLTHSARRLSTTSSSSSLAALVAAGKPSDIALLAPQQGIAWTYEEFDNKARKLAGGLEDLGYDKGSVVISDVPNTAENLLLQTAFAHIGASIATLPKSQEAFNKLVSEYDVRGVICVDGTSEIATAIPRAILRRGVVSSRPVMPTIHIDVASGERSAGGSVPFEELYTHAPPRGDPPLATDDMMLGNFGGAALSHGQAFAMGTDAASKLSLTSSDRVCCSVTLMHAFGIGSAVTSALSVGGAVVLPAVGGIRGCGNPSQRASVTMEVLASTGATVLFGDTHTLKAMAAEEGSAPATKLRTGVVKIGSGATFLDGVTEAPQKDGNPLKLEWQGVKFVAIGKA